MKKIITSRWVKIKNRATYKECRKLTRGWHRNLHLTTISRRHNLHVSDKNTISRVKSSSAHASGHVRRPDSLFHNSIFNNRHLWNFINGRAKKRNSRKAPSIKLCLLSPSSWQNKFQCNCWIQSKSRSLQNAMVFKGIDINPLNSLWRWHSIVANYSAQHGRQIQMHNNNLARL